MTMRQKEQRRTPSCDLRSQKSWTRPRQSTHEQVDVISSAKSSSIPATLTVLKLYARRPETPPYLVLLLDIGDSVNSSHLLDQVVLVERRVQPSSLDCLDCCNSLDASGSAQAVPDKRLGGIHLDVAVLGERPLDGFTLRNITDERAR